MENPPWKTLKSKILFQGAFLKVHADVVRRPDGKRGEYTYIEHPGGVGIVTLDHAGRTILLREYKYPIRSFVVHIPCGGIDKGETSLQAAKRELQEEIGMTAKRWTALGTLVTTEGCSSELVYLFLARNLHQGPIKIQPLEPLQIIRVPLKKAIKMVLDSRITCSYAITGITRAAHKLGVVKL